MYRNGPWNLVLAVIVLLFFFGIGVAHLIWPDYFIKRSGLRKGGEMLTDFNRMGVQAVGAITAGATLYFTYDILKNYFSK
jgi:hypothetical protein